MGIPDHEWQERRKKIADTIDSLGEDYHTPLYDGWLAYIKEMYGSPSSIQPGALKCNLDEKVLKDEAT